MKADRSSCLALIAMLSSVGCAQGEGPPPPGPDAGVPVCALSGSFSEVVAADSIDVPSCPGSVLLSVSYSADGTATLQGQACHVECMYSSTPDGGLSLCAPSPNNLDCQIVIGCGIPPTTWTRFRTDSTQTRRAFLSVGYSPGDAGGCIYEGP